MAFCAFCLGSEPGETDMAQHHDHHGTMVPQDTNFDNADQPGIAQPYSQTEIEDLLYGDDRPASERLARLKELRASGTEASIVPNMTWMCPLTRSFSAGGAPR